MMHNKNYQPEVQPQGTVLRCENVVKIFQDGDRTIPVLGNINFSVSSHESIAIVGRSGSGKTTFIHILGGIEKPSSGKIYLNEMELLTLSEKKRGFLRNRVLGFIFQFHHLLAEFTAFENVCMPLLIRGEPLKDIKAKSLYYLDKVGLLDRKEHKPMMLSGGERQRVAIARALVAEPKCILADEPTGNLDGESADQVYALMMQLAREVGTSFVIVTHDVNLANKMDRTLVLDRGELKEQ
ncbi:MAG: ABC transporter ATP-binding protein [Candidatus Berkiella sp.]